MRKTILMMMLASAVAAPALAQSADAERWREAHEGRAAQKQREVRDSAREVRESRREVEDSKRDVREAMARGDQREARQDMNELRRDRAQLERNKAELRQDMREARQDRDRNWQRDGHRDWDRNDRGTWQRDRRDDRGSWQRDWRRDQRYDWNRWRSENRDRFRADRYYAPRHADYRRWSIGVRISPWIFGQRYWISDPWYYRLPPAYGPYRWVRYYDDVMLVDVRTGMIVDIVYDFFW